MKIVIAGGGRVGSVLAARMREQQHSVVVIDRDEGICNQLFEELGVLTVCGDATDPRILERATVATADIAAGLLASDSANLAFATVVRSMSSARLMVRMLEEQYRTAYRIAGVREVISEADVVVARMSAAVEFPQVAGIMPIAGSGLMVFEVPIDSRAFVAGKNVAALRADPEFPRESLLIGLADSAGNVVVPSGETVITPGQVAILVAHRQDIKQAVACLTSRPAPGETAVGIAPSLRRIELFAPMTDAELVELAGAVRVLRKSSGEVIFRKGDPGEAFYLVLSGEVSLGEPAKELERVKVGGFFGEISLLTGEPRSTTATAASDCELAAIDRVDFRRVVMANPVLALEMSRLLGERLASAARRVEAPKRGIFRR